MRSDPILNAIRDGRRRFSARFARRDVPDGTAPDWGDYYTQIVTLRVSVRTKAFRQHPVGELLSVTPEDVIGNVARNVPLHNVWAEYGESDYTGNGEFEAEGWRMQLLSAVEE